jgi:hypothetical protein
MLWRNSRIRAERTPAAQENTTRLTGLVRDRARIEGGERQRYGTRNVSGREFLRLAHVDDDDRSVGEAALHGLPVEIEDGGLGHRRETSGGVRECVGEGREAVLQAQERDALDLRDRGLELLLGVVGDPLLERLQYLVLRRPFTAMMKGNPKRCL